MPKYDQPLLISVDCEFTGNTPANGELCSIGAVALDPDYNVIEGNDFTANLEWRSGGHTLDSLRLYNPDTMKWWSQWPEQWKAHRTDTQGVLAGMKAFNAWLFDLTERPIFCAFPLAADFGFVDHYFAQTMGDSPFRPGGAVAN